MDTGAALIEYTKEYWGMEFQAAKDRCFGIYMARLVEVIHYATIPISNFIDIAGGTGLLLDAISLYLPDNVSHFCSVEKYSPEDGYRTGNRNFYTCSYPETGLEFQAGLCMEVIENLTPNLDKPEAKFCHFVQDFVVKCRKCWLICSRNSISFE